MEFPIFLLPLVLFIWALIKLRPSSSKLPPGPKPWPVIGNLHNLGSKPHKSLAALAKIHGQIMTLKLGQTTTVVISSSAAAKEALQKQDLPFSGRSVPDAVKSHRHHQLSVVWLPANSRWRALRKILNTHIFSNQKLDSNQDLRFQRVRDLISHARICCENGVAVEIGRAGFRTSLSLLSNTVFSVDLVGESDDSANDFKDLVWGILEEAAKPNLADFFPGLRVFDPQGIRRGMDIRFGKMIALFKSAMDQRMEKRKSDEYNERNDVLDTLLKISEDDNGEMDRAHIEHMFVDLFVAGTDTTSGTVEWAMAEMLKNPETLLKVKAELEQSLGKGTPVRESDITSLTYLQAVVKETFRLHPPVPLLVRKVETNVEICGFSIPKGTRVMVNVWAIGRDPTTWENPDSFVPERFLGSNIDVRGRDFELLPFGTGRRLCPGLPLALRMVHLMLGSLLNSFEWKLERGIAPEEIDMDDKFGITLQKAQPLRAVPVHLSTL